MAKWDKLGSRGHVEDRRGRRPVTFQGGVGGLGVTGLALVLLLTVLSDGQVNMQDVTTVLEQVQVQPAGDQVDTSEFAGEDDYEVFASTVLGSNNDMWENLFAQMNRTYTPPRLVLFRQGTNSGCGFASSAHGPHYCPADSTIYLDETFFDELTRRFGARGGDVAEAYVIAHEVGHHAQKELGIMQRMRTLQQSDPDTANAQSVKLELQADCFAGLWANSIKDLDIFEVNEILEAMDAAAAVGDDRIQQKAGGHIHPESWTHGSSEQRVDAFTTGYTTGSLGACDTFK